MTGKKESLATRRARERGYYQGNEWYCAYRFDDRGIVAIGIGR